MKIQPRTVVVVLVVSTITGFALGFLNALITARGGQPMGAMQLALTSAAFGAVAGALTQLLAGNRAQGAAGEEAQGFAKRFVALPDRAVLHVFRDSFYGKFLGLDVSINDLPLGQTRGKTFFRIELQPGRHQLVGVNPQDGSRAELVIDVAAGELVFVEQKLTMGIGTARTSFVRVAEADGVNRVSRCRLLVPDGAVAAAAV